MLLAYADASGNTGHPSLGRGASLMYSLGCVLIKAEDWPDAFEATLTLRRNLKASYDLPIRTEIKANYLVRGNGPLAPLNYPPAVRGLIYRAHLRALSKMPVRAFAVAVDKRVRTPANCGDCFDLAWEGLLQRLATTSRKERQPFMVVHDEGEDPLVRSWVRRSRRHLTAGSAFGPGSAGDRPAKLLVDDPVPRRSEQSYFVQMADLVAYAAFRYVVPPGGAVATVCPKESWMAMGSAIHRATTGLKPRSAPGIVLR